MAAVGPAPPPATGDDSYEADFEEHEHDDDDGEEEEEEQDYEDDFDAPAAPAAVGATTTAAAVPAAATHSSPTVVCHLVAPCTPAGPITKGRRPMAICSPVAAATPEDVCIAYGASSDKAEHQRQPCGLLLLWRLQAMAASAAAAAGNGCGSSSSSSKQESVLPNAVLACEGAPVACCYGAGACARVVVAATSDGALYAWDLGEAEEKGEAAATHAAFTTAAGAASLCAGSASSSSSGEPVAIAAMAPLAGQTPQSPTADSGGSCSIIVLGASGRINVWSLQRLSADAAAASTSTKSAALLGAAPGSRVLIAHCHSSVDLGPAVAAVLRQRRLASSSSAQPARAARQQQQQPAEVDVCATCLAIVTDDDDACGGAAAGAAAGGVLGLLAGTASGAVLRGAPASEPPPPRAYFPREGRCGCGGASGGGISGSDLEAIDGSGAAGLGVWGAPVVGVAASPHACGAFLTAHSDGRLVLHAGARSSAARVWWWHRGRDAPLVAVRWSPARACVALTLDAAGTVSVYDFAHSAQTPAAAIVVAAAAAAAAAGGAVEKRPLRRACALEVPAAGRGFVVAFDDGSAVWRALPSQWCTPQAGDLDALRALLV